MIVTKLCRQDFAFLNDLEIHLQELYRNQFERGPHTARRQNLLPIEGNIYFTFYLSEMATNTFKFGCMLLKDGRRPFREEKIFL